MILAAGSRTRGIGRPLTWSDFGSDDEEGVVECAACRQACRSIDAPMIGVPIDSIESTSAEAHWSDELVGDYEY